MKQYRVAVVGATGMVGRKFLQVLEERKLPVSEYFLFASKRSAGTTLPFMGREIHRARADRRRVRRAAHRYRPVLRRRGHLAALRPHRRGGRRRGDRQFQLLAHGSGRAARRAGGEPGRHRRLPQKGHHRQPQLLDHPGDGPAQAAPGRLWAQARDLFDLSGRVRRGPAGLPRPGERPQGRSAQEVPASDRGQLPAAHRRVPSTTGTPRRSRR